MSFLSAVSELLHPAPPPSAAVQQVLDRVAEVVAPILKADPASSPNLAAHGTPDYLDDDSDDDGVLDGELLVCEPARVLPMAQRYFLF